MELFREMEKHLSQMEKRFRRFMEDEENRGYYFDPNKVCQEIAYLTLSEEGLRKGDRLYHLFCEAGVCDEFQMYRIMGEWLSLYITSRNHQEAVSRADISPASESAHR